MSEHPGIRKQIRSPKGLVGFTVMRMGPDEEFDPGRLARMMRLDLVEEANAAIVRTGGNPDHWRAFLERDEADVLFWAAQLLSTLHEVDRRIRELDECITVACSTARQCIADSLAVAHTLECFRKVEHETAIVARESQKSGGRHAARKKADTYFDRHRKIAADYKRRTMSRSNKSTSALMEQVGRDHGLKSRSGAIKAVKRALEKVCPDLLNGHK